MSSPNRALRMAETVSRLILPMLVVSTGLLFLADYHHGWQLADTWPILLIVWGLGKVAEHAARIGE